MPSATQNLTPPSAELPELQGQSNGAHPEAHDLPDWLDQLLLPPAASEGDPQADLAGLNAQGLIVLVGSVSDGEHGIPQWHSMSGDPWILV